MLSLLIHGATWGQAPVEDHVKDAPNRPHSNPLDDITLTHEHSASTTAAIAHPPDSVAAHSKSTSTHHG